MPPYLMNINCASSVRKIIRTSGRTTPSALTSIASDPPARTLPLRRGPSNSPPLIEKIRRSPEGVLPISIGSATLPVSVKSNSDFKEIIGIPPCSATSDASLGIARATTVAAVDTTKTLRLIWDKVTRAPPEFPGLMDAFIPLLAKASSTQRADNSRSHGLAQAEGVSDSYHEIADFDPVAVTQRDGLEVAPRTLQLKNGNVGCRVTPNQFCVELSSVLGRDLGL